VPVLDYSRVPEKVGRGEKLDRDEELRVAGQAF